MVIELFVGLKFVEDLFFRQISKDSSLFICIDLK